MILKFILPLLLGSLGCNQSGVTQHDDGAVDIAPASPATLRAAQEALAANRPWQASQLLAPALRDSARRSSDVVLLAARAAAAWQGWAAVEQLLRREPWLDTMENGAGRFLLAQASFELRQQDAVQLSARAAQLSPDDGARLVLLARSLERSGASDSARATYARSATMLPLVADWLSLRAAGLTRDSATRAGIYASLTTPAARLRPRRVEAAALERFGQLQQAIAMYASLSLPVEALRLRISTARDSMSRAAIRREVLALITGGERHARPAIDLFDRLLLPHSAAEELIVARTAARVGPPARAAAGFGRAAARTALNAQDRFTYGLILSQLGRDREAVAQFAGVRTSALAGRASYRRARSLLRAGDGAHARAALDTVTRAFSGDAAAAPAALYLRADLATDDGDDPLARRLFLALGRQYPTSDLAPSARFRAALIRFVARDERGSAFELDSLAARYPNSSETLASRYWSGRALAAAGDSTVAVARWTDVIRRDPHSYYSTLSRARLGAGAWQPVAAVDSFVRAPALDAGFARARLLAQLGLTPEAGLEYQHLATTAGESSELLLAAAAGFREAGVPSRAMQLARQAMTRGISDARAYRLAYPVGMQDVLMTEAAANRVDYGLVAAVIRQESNFEPRATSPVGARGLMQIMPAVGQQLARARGFATWDAALLYQPDVSLQLGTVHLADLMRRYPQTERVLAAYNAGSARVDRWAQKAGTDDAEIFVERIPFVETRDYVRIVQRNREVYRALYEGSVSQGP